VPSVVLPYPEWAPCAETVWVTEYALTTTTRSSQAPNVGNRVEMAKEWLRSGGSVLLFGPAGIGKSAALDVLTAAAVGARVLRCAPGSADAERAYRALAQLLSSVTESDLSLLPVARRRVLEGLLHRGVGSFHGPALGRARRTRWSPRVASTAVQLATWNLVRVLARSHPLLLVVDNLDRVDRASADVLRFVASRVEGLTVHMIAAERVPAEQVPAGRQYCPAPLLMTRPDPMFAAIAPETRGVPDNTGAPENPDWRGQGGNGAPWAVCRRSPDSVA
jgi:hypothetical protein